MRRRRPHIKTHRALAVNPLFDTCPYCGHWVDTSDWGKAGDNEWLCFDQEGAPDRWVPRAYCPRPRHAPRVLRSRAGPAPPAPSRRGARREVQVQVTSPQFAG